MRTVSSLAAFAVVAAALRFFWGMGWWWALAFATLAAVIPFTPVFDFGSEDVPLNPDA